MDHQQQQQQQQPDHLALHQQDDANHPPDSEAIINVLANLQPAPAPTETGIAATGSTAADPSIGIDQIDHAHRSIDLLLDKHQHDGLEGWGIPALRREVERLRGLLRSYGHTEAEIVLPPHTAKTEILPRVKRKRKARDESEVADKPKKEKKVVVKAQRDDETGKRLEKGRRTELGRALRAKMRASMSIGPDDPLPPPTVYADGVEQMREFVHWGVPNWLLPGDPVNTIWFERMATEIIDEAGNGEHTKIPPEDRDPEIVKAAARTAFLNFCKRYLAENDPQKALKKDRYIKNRRRWARKDLKQKKRSKAALDPSFSPSLPPTALHLDYMSSEYSSAGENSADEGDEALDVKSVRSQRWAEMLAVKASEPSLIEGKGGWAEGLGEKVLEVRTPRWRSSALNDMYKRLDAISAFSSSRTPPADPSLKGGTRAGHVAPSHRRFVLEDRYARKGKAPRELGEDWMWKSGRVGAWSDGDRSTDAMQRPVGTAEGEGDGVSILFGEEDWREDETGALVNALQGIPE